MITSTGSPLVKESFEYVYKNIKKNVHLPQLVEEQMLLDVWF